MRLASLVLIAALGGSTPSMAGTGPWRAVRLSSPRGYVERAALSPDGRWLLAYGGAEHTSVRAWVMRLADRRWIRGPKALEAAWGPDSRTVALRDGVLSEPGVLRTWNVVTGASSRLHQHATGSPAFSPSGDRVAFIRGGDNALCLLPVTGAGTRPVVLRWSPWLAAEWARRKITLDEADLASWRSPGRVTIRLRLGMSTGSPEHRLVDIDAQTGKVSRLRQMDDDARVPGHGSLEAVTEYKTPLWARFEHVLPNGRRRPVGSALRGYDYCTAVAAGDPVVVLGMYGEEPGAQQRPLPYTVWLVDMRNSRSVRLLQTKLHPPGCCCVPAPQVSLSADGTRIVLCSVSGPQRLWLLEKSVAPAQGVRATGPSKAFGWP